MSRRSNGRPKGSITKRCLIKDPILLPYEIHIDDTSHSFQVVKADSGNIDGYYTQLPLALKSILKKRCVPNDGETYTLKGYIADMVKVRDDMATLLSPIYHELPPLDIPNDNSN